jgi:hypothetical protein
MIGRVDKGYIVDKYFKDWWVKLMKPLEILNWVMPDTKPNYLLEINPQKVSLDR